MKPTLTSLVNLSRFSPQSHLLSVQAASYEQLQAYSPTNLLAWIKHVGLYWFGAKHAFPSYQHPATGIFSLGNQAQVSVAGDWGTGTKEAEKVAARIFTGNPDFTIHLGDIYYTGARNEVFGNFLGSKIGPFDPVRWPRGKTGTFALLGNHEMFTHGEAYFELLLPALGQPASYFCLENDFWRIVAIDTGYNSTGLDFGPFKPSCTIPDAVLAWLESLKLEGDKRGLILMSHHQPWSLFDRWYPNPAKQLAQFIHRPVLWFWGHEHRMAVYDEYSVRGGITAHGACIGHGGMPIELKAPSKTRGLSCVYTDQREYANSEGLRVGFNGYANLLFDSENLRVDFRDLEGWLVYTEQWTPSIL